MIVEFSVQNFRSIKDLQTLSFKATKLKSSNEFSYVDKRNIFSADDEPLLRTVGIYGPNGSGKSNIIRALESFIEVLSAEPTSESNLKTLTDPFLYQEDPTYSECFFQIVLKLNGRKYRYGLTTARVYERNEANQPVIRETVTKEWLQGVKVTNMTYYFTRSGRTTSIHEPLMPSKIPELPYKHSILLTHISAFDPDSVCSEIRTFLKSLTISNFSKGFSAFRWHSFRMIEDKGASRAFLDFLAVFNLRYHDVFFEKREGDQEDRLDRVFFIKKVKDMPGPYALNLVSAESAGTQRLFEIAGLLYRAFTMPKGGVIILDEIDSNFHPYLVLKIVQLFNDPDTNLSNCQLLFTSHDTNLLSPEVLRRDQIYFTEKTVDESTRLYSLADLRGIRNDADFAKQYLGGYYGALPVLDQFVKSLSDE